jgi:hypothetical protein
LLDSKKHFRGAVGVSGTYHREESPTQTKAHANLQQQTQMVCGKGARQSGGGISPFATAKAFVGPLPAGRRGVEFTTTCVPRYKQPYQGGLSKWYAGDLGVITQSTGLACIAVTITLVTQ